VEAEAKQGKGEQYRGWIAVELPLTHPMVRFRRPVGVELTGAVMGWRSVHKVSEVHVPGHPAVIRKHLNQTGPLTALLSLSTTLAQRYSWIAAEAATFVLTGFTPPIDRMRVATHVNNTQPLLSRITIEVDPYATAEEVKKAYSAAKRKLFYGLPPAAKKPKQAVLLLEFMIGRPRNSHERNRVAWNHKYPDMTFKHRSDFQQALDRAVKLVLDPRGPVKIKGMGSMREVWEELCGE